MVERVKRIVKAEKPPLSKVAAKRFSDHQWLVEQTDKLFFQLESGYNEAMFAVGQMRGYTAYSRVMGEKSIEMELRGLIISAEKIIRKLYSTNT